MCESILMHILKYHIWKVLMEGNRKFTKKFWLPQRKMWTSLTVFNVNAGLSVAMYDCSSPATHGGLYEWMYGYMFNVLLEKLFCHHGILLLSVAVCIL